MSVKLRMVFLSILMGVMSATAADQLVFTANDGTNGNEPWSYNGSDAPSIIQDIGSAVQANSSSPRNFKGGLSC